MRFTLDLADKNQSHYLRQRSQLIMSGNIVKIQNVQSQNGKYLFPFNGEVITDLKMPIAGVYRIEAWGAQGDGGSTAPKGAYSKSLAFLKFGERIKILVGEKGYNGKNEGKHIYCGGGGGGSFVAKGLVPLCVAGGGGSLNDLTYSSVQEFACGQNSQYGGDHNTGRGALTMGGK